MGAILVALATAEAAVSVASNQPNDLVLKVRDRVVLDERELLAKPRRQHCSSEQGPFCRQLDAAGAKNSLGNVFQRVSERFISMNLP